MMVAVKTFDYVAGPDELVLGNISGKAYKDDATVVVFEFSTGGYGLDFASAVRQFEEIVDKAVGSNDVFWVLKSVEMDDDRSSWGARQKIHGVWRVSVKNRDDVIRRFYNL